MGALRNSLTHRSAWRQKRRLALIYSQSGSRTVFRPRCCDETLQTASDWNIGLSAWKHYQDRFSCQFPVTRFPDSVKLLSFDLFRSLPVHTNLRASFRVYILICVTDAWNVKMNHSDIIASSEIRPGNLFPPGYASQEEMWNAVQNRKELRDSSFVFAVRSTGIYCRPACPARRPSRKNVVFFKEALDAEKNGYRPCLRCKPENAMPQETEIVRKLCA